MHAMGGSRGGTENPIFCDFSGGSGPRCTTVISPARSHSFRVSGLFSRSLYFLLLTGRVPPDAYWVRFPQLDSCVPAYNHELESHALLNYFLGVYRNLLEHANLPIFFSLMSAAKAQASLCIGKTLTEPSLF